MKRTGLTAVLLLLFFQMDFAAQQSTNQWKMVIYPFINKSEKGREENLKLVVQNSIKTFLSKVDYLNVSVESGEKSAMKDVFNEAYTNGYDIVVNGSYAVIGEKIYIYVTVYDVLQRLLKLENSYSGSAGQDIFDTIDVIINSLKQDVTKTVKPMDEETLVKYRKRVELVADDIKLSRSFVTTLGFNGSFYDHFTWLPFIQLEVRLGDILVGFSSFMPLLINNSNSLDTWKNNMNCLYAGYRFGSFIPGAGVMTAFSLITIRSYTSNIAAGYQIAPAFMAPMAFLKYEMGPDFSLKASFSMIFLDSHVLISIDIAEPHRTILVPVYSLGMDYYLFENWGIKLDFYYASFFESFQTLNGRADFNGGNFLALIGINYKVDFN